MQWLEQGTPQDQLEEAAVCIPRGTHCPDQVPGHHQPASTMYEDLYLNNKQFTIPWFLALSKVTKHSPVEMAYLSHRYLTCRHFH